LWLKVKLTPIGYVVVITICIAVAHQRRTAAGAGAATTVVMLLVYVVGLAQCTELCWQLRGVAGKRQVDAAKVALQHNVGLGGACVVTMYRRGFPS